MSENGQGWNVLFFLFITIPFNVLLDAHPRQWFAMSLAAALGVLVSLVSTLALGLSGDTTSVLASFAVGVMGGLHSWITDHPPLINVLNGRQSAVGVGCAATSGVSNLMFVVLRKVC